MEKAKKKISVQKCFIIILLVQVIALVGWGIAKKGYFIDELFTYGMSNSVGWRVEFYDMYKDYLNNWHDTSLFHEYLTVQRDGRFDFAGVVNNVSADVHPPIYFLIIHAVCSLMPDVFTKWFGILPNIVFFIITQILIYLLAVELYGNKKYSALIPGLIYGFSVGAINSVTLIRPYMILAMLCTLQFYIHVKLWNAVRQKDKKHEWMLLICLLFSTCIGFLTQYYYVIFAFFISAAYSIIQMLRKNWKHFVKYAVAMFGGLAAAYFVFPTCYQHILGQDGINTYRGEEAFNNLKNSDLAQGLSAFLQIVNEELFCGLLGYILIATLFVLALYVFRRHFQLVLSRCDDAYCIEVSKRAFGNGSICFSITDKGIFSIIAGVGCFGYTVILAKIAAFQTDRYIFCIYPLVILCFCYIIQALAKHFKWNSGLTMGLLLGIALTGYTFQYNGEAVCYLYTGDEERYARFDEFSNMGVVYVTEGDWSNVANMLYLSKVESVYCVPQRNIGDLVTVLDEYNKSHDELLVIIENYKYGDRKSEILRDIIDATEYNEYEYELFIQDDVYRLKKKANEAELSSGYYVIRNSLNETLHVEKGAVDNLANVIVASEDAGSTVFCQKIGSVYEMTFIHSRKMLDLNNGLAENGTNIQQYEWNGMGAQEWSIVPTEDGEGYYVLFGEDYAMTADSVTGNVELRRFSGDENQVWFFEHKKQ